MIDAQLAAFLQEGVGIHIGTRDEARRLLPQVREWFKQLSRARGLLSQRQPRDTHAG